MELWKRRICVETSERQVQQTSSLLLHFAQKNLGELLTRQLGLEHLACRRGIL